MSRRTEPESSWDKVTDPQTPAAAAEGESPLRDGECFARVYHQAKAASGGPTRQDAIDAGWNAVAAAALRAQSDSPSLRQRIFDAAQAVYALNAEQWPASGDYVRTLLLKLCEASPSPRTPAKAAVEVPSPETALPTIDELRILTAAFRRACTDEDSSWHDVDNAEQELWAAIQQLHSRASEPVHAWIVCKECGSATKGVHWGNCRASASREVSEEDVERALSTYVVAVKELGSYVPDKFDAAQPALRRVLEDFVASGGTK